jgi:adenylate cyclase
MSGDPGKEFLANAITENIITGLSKFRDLLVIASTSTFAYKGRAVKIQDVSRDLGVQYVLEGSVQKGGDRIRITAQLIEGDTGRHVWSHRYDRAADDVFAVLDEVTDMIVASLASGYGGRLRKAWQSRSDQIGTRNFQAFDFFQRGMDTFNRYTRTDLESARELFQKAIALDPKYANPYSKIAWSHICDVYLGWSDNSERSFNRALEYAKLAVACDDEEPWGNWAMAGYYLFCTQDYNRAIAAYERALETNPNDADVLNDFGQCLSYAGRAKEAVEVVQRAMRLNPHYPEYWMMQFGPILFDARRYEDSIAMLENLRSVDTTSVELYLAASYAALARLDKAHKAVSRVLQLDPKMTITRCTSPEFSPYKEPNDLEHLRRNLHEAGLPK